MITGMSHVVGVIYALVTVSYVLEFWVSWPPVLRRLRAGVLAAGIAAHLGLEAHRLLDLQRQVIPLTAGEFAYLSFSWLTLFTAGLMLWLEVRHAVSILGAFAMPWAFGCWLLAGHAKGLGARAATGLAPAYRSGWMGVHLASSLAAEACFAVAFGVAAAYLVQERQLKSKRLGVAYHALPSLDVLDGLNARVAAAGAVLLAVGIATGLAWSAQAFGQAWRLGPKEAGAVATWVWYAAALGLRWGRGWRGRRFAFLGLAGFAAALVTFLGVNVLAPGLHGF